MPKQLTFNNDRRRETHEKIQNGIHKLAQAVRITLGPSGRVVMFEREGMDPVITKDGVTVAKQVELPDPEENMAAAMIRQAAAKTAAAAGDGTTTATIYAEAIYEAGNKYISAGANPQDVKRGIQAAVNELVKKLAEAAKPIIDIEQIRQVAICSSNQDTEIGNVIADAIDAVGKDGVVTIEEGRTLETFVNTVSGLQIPRGYISPQLANKMETLTVEYDEPMILVTDQKLDNVRPLLRVLEITARLGRPLVIIADEFSDDIIAFLILNKIKNHLNAVGVRAPGFGDRRRDTLEDIAIATGATLITSSGVNFDSVSEEHFGTCQRVVIDRDTTTIIDGKGNEQQIEARIQLLQTQLSKMVGDFDKERVQERLARLTGSIAQIVVGGATETEVREKKDRIDDALHACKAAIQEGVLPGGGVAAIHAFKNITIEPPNEDFAFGVDAVRKAVEAPLRQIAVNTGHDPGVVVDKILAATDSHFGFDAARERYGDMIEFGIIVPAKVERVALQNAASVAGLLLTTDCLISIIRQPQTQDAPDMGPLGLGLPTLT